jgi:translation initiation factor IF-2
MENSGIKLASRPAVITIMGHIDHGKTTLLDYIRKSRITKTEAGGITQHVGAYQVEFNGVKLTFIDTPGHAAFRAIRSRGVKTADIVVIVIAGDEGVKPQTIEAIQEAKGSKLPIVVAITKIDKEDISLDKIKAELVELELTPDDWGGNVIVCPLSSVTGDGVDNFLENLTLVAEMSELKANMLKEATDGFILESFLDSKMGALCDMIVLNGYLETGDVVLAGNKTYGKVKKMTDDLGKDIKKALPGTPVRILGLKSVADAGDFVRLVKNESEALSELEKQKVPILNEINIPQVGEGHHKELNIILKGDSQGSLDAIQFSIGEIVKIDLDINILVSEIGDINATDIKTAKNENAIIIGFGLKPDKKIQQVAEQSEIVVKYYKLIYDLLDEIRELLKAFAEPKIIRNDLGKLKIMRVFKEDKKSLILGGRVIVGKMVRGSMIEILDSMGKVFFKGKITELQQNKEDVSEVLDGRECGIQAQVFLKKRNPSENDELVAFEHIKKKIV